MVNLFGQFPQDLACVRAPRSIRGLKHCTLSVAMRFGRFCKKIHSKEPRSL